MSRSRAHEWIAISEEAKIALQARGHDVDVGDPLEGMGISQFISFVVSPETESIDGSNIVPSYKISALSGPRTVDLLDTKVFILKKVVFYLLKRSVIIG